MQPHERFQIPVKRRNFLQGAAAMLAAPAERPNIVLAVADDLSWAHTGATGDRYVRTPAFDRVAREGVLFTHAFCGAPSCAPSRAAMLTGQEIWRLEQGAHMRSHLPRKFAVYPDLLEAAGYRTGYTGKGWGPGRLQNSASYAIPAADERKRNPAGEVHKSFGEFLAARKPGAPFCFWYGSTNPHRPFRHDPDAAKGRESLLRVPKFLPDCPEVRADVADYYTAVERFDREVDGILQALDGAGLAGNTIVAVTSDNGMGGMPRAKCNLYDWGVRMPLAIRWPDRVKGGRAVGDFVSLSDLAPTFLEAGGVAQPEAMTGRSLMGTLRTGARARGRVFTARERHSPTREKAVGYPMRALRTHEFLYIRNYAPERWPAGDPPGSTDVDPSPTREYMIAHRDDSAVQRFFDLAFGRRPAEELYDLKKDADQMNNLAGEPSYRAARERMARELDEYLKKTGDPRAFGRGEVFDTYPFWSGAER
jgi:N-sulfoglucosamine sulfohydrolase